MFFKAERIVNGGDSIKPLYLADAQLLAFGVVQPTWAMGFNHLSPLGDDFQYLFTLRRLCQKASPVRPHIQTIHSLLNVIRRAQTPLSVLIVDQKESECSHYAADSIYKYL